MADIDELRVQPQDILAEQSVLGAIFIDESKLVFVREYIEPNDFFKYANDLFDMDFWYKDGYVFRNN